MDKKEVSVVLEEIALLLEMKGDNPFKIRAYTNAARSIELLDQDIEELVAKGRLGEIKGIGKALQEKIGELVTTGTLKYYEDLKQSFPKGLFELLKIPGLGPKRVKIIYDNLGITTLEELEYACNENRLAGLPGFGYKTQENILNGIENFKEYKDKFLFSEAYREAEILIEYLKTCEFVDYIDIAGSLRRKKEIIKDIDILVGSDHGEKVMDFFVNFTHIKEVVAKGTTKTSLRLESGIAVDLRVVSTKQYPYALHHFTGSKEHNTAMRHYAKQKNIKMNEYGLFNVSDNSLILCYSEEDIFSTLGMQYIPPEIRENTGEIEIALKNQLPDFVILDDIIGILHVHSNYSDGRCAISELAEYAYKLGYKYIGISDHSKSASYAHGLNEEDIMQQHEEIDRLNKKFSHFKILKGIEVDILKNGSLDYDTEVLESFDFVIASVHSNFSMNKEEMTERILKAMDNPYVTILGHPTGRLLLSRPAYEIEMEKVFQKASENGVAIEINANPHRLDLDWRWCRKAKELGIKFAICPDAHDLEGFSHMQYGVGIARKGWLEKGDIINCYGIDNFI